MSPILGSIGGLSARAYGFQTLTTAPFVPDGAYEVLSTVTVPAAGVSFVEFGAIPNTYRHLQIRVIAHNGTAVNDQIRMQLNGDTAANYSQHELSGFGTSPNAYGYANLNQMVVAFTTYSTIPAHYGAAIIDLLDYQNTSKNKTVKSLTGYNANASGGGVGLLSGNWRSTSAINLIKLYPSSGNIAQYSQFTLYGVK